MAKKSVVSVTLGGVFCALFFVSSNILPPIMVIPSVPITLQVMVLALTAAVLGLRGGLLTLTAIYLLTIAGVPMMSGFGGGPGAILRPTGGFILGWIFLMLILGLYTELLAPRLREIPVYGRILHLCAFTAAGFLGSLLMYLSGAVFLAFYNGSPQTAGPVFVTTLLSFGIIDAVKIAGAGIVATALDRILMKTAGRDLRV